MSQRGYLDTASLMISKASQSQTVLLHCNPFFNLNLGVTKIFKVIAIEVVWKYFI